MFSPYEFQTEAISSIFNYFQKGNKGNPLVVAPTGSGKSVIIACFCGIVANTWEDQKILVISHVKEILDQNYSAIKKQLYKHEIGLYSAGLKSKTIRNITVAGIQTIYNKPELFDQFNIIIVDEAHTIPHTKNGMYRKFFNQVTKPVIGFTATPYRLGYGYLHLGEDRFFNDIIYSIPYRKLQDEGYLCQLTTKGAKKKLDPEGIKKQAGDFMVKELALAFDRETITKEIVSELLIYKELRRKWLLFAIDIKHAEHIADELNAEGISAVCIHSKMSINRDSAINDFRDGKYQAAVSVAVMTTGIDIKNIDMICLLRNTQSPALNNQMIGRGLRVHQDKKDCLVLDFAGNIVRCGPIDAPIIKMKYKGSGGDPIMKECDNCYEIVHAAVRICTCCGTEFKFKHKLTSTADDRELLSLEAWYDVKDVKYFKYMGSKGIPMLKVSYMCGVRRFNEYVCLQHTGYAKHKAKYWWTRRCSEIDPPDTAQLGLENSHLLSKPDRILVEESGKYPNIKEMEF